MSSLTFSLLRQQFFRAVRQGSVGGFVVVLAVKLGVIIGLSMMAAALLVIMPPAEVLAIASALLNPVLHEHGWVMAAAVILAYALAARASGVHHAAYRFLPVPMHCVAALVQLERLLSARLLTLLFVTACALGISAEALRGRHWMAAALAVVALDSMLILLHALRGRSASAPYVLIVALILSAGGEMLGWIDLSSHVYVVWSAIALDGARAFAGVGAAALASVSLAHIYSTTAARYDA